MAVRRRLLAGRRSSSRSVWAASAVLGVLLARCEADCPPGTSARFDQCQTLSHSRDAAGDEGTAVSDAAHEEPHVTEEGGDASDASAAGDADADAGCDGDRFWSAGRCVLRELHVDATNGDDTQDGGRERPLKTFARAMRVAVAGQIVSFAPGTYAVEAAPDARPDTAGVIPADITLRTERDVPGRAVLDGGRERSLTFLGGVSLQDLDLVHFVASIVATAGEQKLMNVRIAEAESAVTLVGRAHLICDACRFEGQPLRSPLILGVSGDATATLKGSVLLTEPAACVLPMAALIDVGDSANLVLDHAQLSGAFQNGVLLHTQGGVQIRSSTFTAGCTSNSLSSRHDPAATSGSVEIDDSEFAGAVDFEGGVQRVRARRSIFRFSLGIAWALGGVYDFGMPTGDGAADPGGNTIEKLVFIGKGLVVFASRNTWNAGAQGADAQGHFPDGHIWTVTPGEAVDGANFTFGVIENAMQVLF